MHSCVGGLAQKAMDLESDLDDVEMFLDQASFSVMEAGQQIDDSGRLLQSYAEGSASPLAQAAIVAAGPVLKSGEDLESLYDEVSDLQDEGESLLAEIDFSDETSISYEDRQTIEKYSADANDIFDASEQAAAAAMEFFDGIVPDLSEGSDAAGATYVPVLRQIGAENETQMSVCNGDLTGTPKVGLSYDECAASCDAVAPKSSPKYCWAFQYFTFPDKDPLCFHFSDLTAITSYDCDFVTSTLVQSSKTGPVHVKSFLEKKHKRKHKHRKHHKHHKKHKKVRKASAAGVAGFRG